MKFLAVLLVTLALEVSSVSAGVASSRVSQDVASSDVQPGTASEKLDAVWARITATKNSASWYPVWKLLGLFTEDMNKSFDVASDSMPDGRKKLIHT